MEQIVQIVGAVLILAAFVSSQLRVIEPASLRYLVPNLVGSAALAVDAYAASQWGFVLLEGVWALVSAVVVAGLRRRPSDPDPAGSRGGRRRSCRCNTRG
jgi:hypothetical protein